jgi:hypothetical protein
VHPDARTTHPPIHPQAFLLGAMKFHCYVAALPAAPAPGARVLLEAIETGGARRCTDACVVVVWARAWEPQARPGYARAHLHCSGLCRLSAAVGCIHHDGGCSRPMFPPWLDVIQMIPSPPPPPRKRVGIAFMASLTRRRRVASAHYRGLEQACCTAVPRAHVRRARRIPGCLFLLPKHVLRPGARNAD